MAMAPRKTRSDREPRPAGPESVVPRSYHEPRPAAPKPPVPRTRSEPFGAFLGVAPKPRYAVLPAPTRPPPPVDPNNLLERERRRWQPGGTANGGDGSSSQAASSMQHSSAIGSLLDRARTSRHPDLQQQEQPQVVAEAGGVQQQQQSGWRAKPDKQQQQQQQSGHSSKAVPIAAPPARLNNAGTDVESGLTKGLLTEPSLGRQRTTATAEERAAVQAAAAATAKPARARGCAAVFCDACSSVCVSIMSCGSIMTMLVDVVDTNALQCVVLLFLPLTGAVSYLVYHLHFRKAPPWAPSWLELEEGEPLEAPPSPPSAPDWAKRATTAALDFGVSHPLLYLSIDLGSALLLGLVVLFWKDITELWQWHRKRAAASLIIQRGYRRLSGSRALLRAAQARGEARAERKMTIEQRAAIEKRRVELRDAMDRVEELEIKAKGRRLGAPALLKELRQQRDKVHRLRAELKAEGVVEQAEGGLPLTDGVRVAGLGWGKLQPIKRLASWMVTEQSRRHRRTAVRGSGLMLALKGSANGLLTVSIYFADIISDVQVLLLLWSSGNRVWAIEAAVLLVAQYVAVYLRVLPYLRTTFGAASWHYRIFLILGFPFGLVALDLLMFLEPFGLLAVLPLPQWLKQFVPAYKATRVIAEVTIESMPQCLLQSYILVVIEQRVRSDTAEAADLAMLPFASVLPKSITISTLAMLKTWVELVLSSRQAGLTVSAKVKRLWNVGEGLPLDALQKGSIVEWECAYKLTPEEVPPLLDALEMNLSLMHLDLARSGLTWDGPGASGAPLIEAIATDRGALASLHSFVISHESRLRIPIEHIREGGERAAAALEAIRFFAAGGARSAEIMFMADVLRLNRGTMSVVDEPDVAAAQTATRLLDEARAGHVDKAQWERRVKALVVSGDLARDVLASLVAVELLRSCHFEVRELRSVGFGLDELRQGGFTASELKAAGVPLAELKALGYSLKQLREGGVTAAESKALDYSVEQMHQGGYTAAELKAVRISLDELKAVGYKPRELKAAGVAVAELRRVGYTAKELHAADFKADDMRSAGYAATEMKAGGFDAKRLRAVGFSATELRAGGFTAAEMRMEKSFKVSELKSVGYTAVELREGGFGAREMEKGGFLLHELKTAGFSIESLKTANYEWHDLAIQCSASYDDLIRAGFTRGQEGLDPNHQLFRAAKADKVVGRLAQAKA